MARMMRKAFFISLVVSILSLSVMAPSVNKPVNADYSMHVEIDNAILVAFEYFQTQQNDDGGIRWFDDASNVPTTIRVVLALAATGFSQDAMQAANGNRPIDFLSAAGYDWVFQVGADEPGLNVARAGQLLTAVAAANANPYTFGEENVNLVNLIQSAYQPDLATFGSATPDNVIDQVWSILGLAATHASIPEDALTWLINAQNPDGSWDDGFGSYLDTTPLALLALAAANMDNIGLPAFQTAIEFMISNQEQDGGWQTEWDSATNANTTGMIIQGLVAAAAIKPETYAENIADARSALLAIQQESGLIGGDFGNAYSTAEAVLGLSNQPLFNLGKLRRVSHAFDFILDAQEPDGSWGTVGQTLDVILTLTAAGWDPATIQQGGQSPLDYLNENLAAYLEVGPDAIGKSILGLVASKQDPLSFNNIDLIAALMETFDPTSGAFGSADNSWHQSLALLGLSAADQPIPEGAVDTLVQLQQEDGGWEYLPGFGTWPDNTALALQALIGAGVSLDADPVKKGLEHLRSQQLENGGWGDASTTAYAILAFNSLGMDLNTWQTETGRTPITSLLTFQNPSGAFMFSLDFPDDNMLATTAAVLALLSGSYRQSATQPTTSNVAGLVVHTDPQTATLVCVPFVENSISGLTLLDSSGIAYQAQDGFMDSILEITNPQGGTMYWSYWRWDGREWTFKNTGAGDSLVLPGSIEAWYFTSWEVFPSLPPDSVPHLKPICGENVLKYHADQPYLSYYDLFQPEEIDSLCKQCSLINEDESRLEMSSTATSEAASAESLPLTPIIIIAAVGLIVIVFIVGVLLKKK